MLPIIDVAPLVVAHRASAQAAVARDLDAAARRYGFFYAVNHGVDAALIDRLVSLSRAFFAQAEAEKIRIPMVAGGRAWRGYFPLGGELTSNRPDWKEGLYLGGELGPEHPRVRAAPSCMAPTCGPWASTAFATPCSHTSMRSRV